MILALQICNINNGIWLHLMVSLFQILNNCMLYTLRFQESLDSYVYDNFGYIDNSYATQKFSNMQLTTLKI